jgi:hypothetical protein
MNNERFILAIDPGTTQSAFVYWDSDMRVIREKGILQNDEMLNYIIHTCKSYPGSNSDVVAIEMVASYGMPVGKEVFETVLWIGRYWQASTFPVRLVYRREVKIHLCGSMKAKDSNIRQALIDMLGKDVTKGVSKDVWSALGVAVTVKGMSK